MCRPFLLCSYLFSYILALCLTWMIQYNGMELFILRGL